MRDFSRPRTRLGLGSPGVLAASLLAALVACDDGDDGGDSTDGNGTADAAPAGADAGNPFEPPPAGGQQLVTDEYTLQPGEEKYFCYTFDSPADAAKGITAVKQLSGQLVHHVALYTTLTPEPQGFSECNVLIKFSWRPLWAAGAGSNSLTLPEGVGFKVPAGTQYLIQYHLQNTTEAPITERSALNLTYADPAPLQPASIYALGQFSLNIPKDAMGFTQETSCNSAQDMTVFAAFPHMHKLGTKITFEHGPTEAEATMAYALDPWIFGDQPFDPMDLEIKQGDFMRARCTWDNDTGHDVGFGESSDDEMCIFVLYAYPLEGANGCGF
jgi:hypothetical protein